VPLIDESQIRIILLDIEGTTTPVTFVYQTLFPYASRKVESYLREHDHDPEIQSLIQELRGQHEPMNAMALSRRPGRTIQKSTAAFERRLRANG